jgi:lipopolysaccharide transport system ATP-binding protein
LDTPVKHYSSGMYVRLAFAVAAHLEPEILIIDEVLAVGDADFQRKCLGKMQDIAGNGRTVLFVSHNLEAVDRLTSRCIHLQSGTLLEDGPTPSVVANYLKKSTSDTLDLARFRTTSLPATVSLKGLWAESMDGTRCAAFRQGEPFRIVLEVEAESPISCDYAIVLENGQQHPLYTTHLSDLSAPLNTKGRQRLAADFQQPQLRRGAFGVSVAIFSPDKQSFYDVVLHYPLLEIAGTIGSDFPDDIRWGDLYVPVRWKVE